MKIQIPTPCHENWETMLPAENGRYCNNCCKTVVDFTGMTPDTISAYLLQHQSQKICGRFTDKQLAMEYDVDVYTATTHISRSGWPLVKRIAALFILLFVLSQTGNAQVSKNEQPNVIVTSNCTKRIGKVVPKTGPFTAPLPKLVQVSVPAPGTEVSIGGVVITNQKGRTKRKLKRLQKQERKKQAASDQLTGEVVVVAGMVQTD